MGHALLSFNRKDQGDPGASLSFNRKDCCDLASPCSASIVWSTLCYPSTKRTKDQGDLGASLSFSRKGCCDIASPCSVSIVWGTLCYPSTKRTKKGPLRSSFPVFNFNRMGHALLSFNRKDQGDLGASLSFSRKDRRDLASPFLVSTIWGTLFYPSIERTKVI
ncbi:hypothetical protein V6N12_045817 [Hibiscus sabdariffa]|uniref:Uncharacterized protein n=1 Tax=Hibiscus sabdariffa TaxID=183260 RepID=A0ABR2G448_9ROSI